MDRWIFYAIISMLFAGFTAVIAKQGLDGISAELGITLRTIFVCFFIIAFGLLTIAPNETRLLKKENFIWLSLSAVTTSISWIFYYKELKLSDVATVSLIDKGSVVISVLLAWWLFKEVITIRIIIGALLVVTGIIVISKK